MARIEFDRNKKRTKLLDNSLTPAEIAKFIEDNCARDLPFELRSLLESGQAPVGYVRQSWSENAHYYTANRGARSLLVVFCGMGGRPGCSISYFLQSLRDDLYDVLVLQDPGKVHFSHGVLGVGSGFLDVIRRISAFAEANGFAEIITYGASMGGYPALRAGILLGATRAISISGSYIWHVGRLIRKESTGGAFDLLCPCFSHTATELVAVVPARNEQDVRSLEILQATFPKCVAVKINTDQHKIAAFFSNARLLRLFHACLFECWKDVSVRTALLVFGEEAAIHSNWIEARIAETTAQKIKAVEQRYEQELKALYVSTSWRLTEPLRRVTAVMRRIKESWASGRSPSGET